MDRVFQWLWDRYAARYSWALWALIVLVALPLFLLWSFAIVAFERSNQYIAAALFTVVAVPIRAYILVLPASGEMRTIERWAADKNLDAREALDATYSYARRTVMRLFGSDVVCTALFAAVIGVIAGATASRIAQYAVLGAALGICNMLIAVHSFVE